jgi:hypothetical protein
VGATCVNKPSYSIEDKILDSILPSQKGLWCIQGLYIDIGDRIWKHKK